MRRALLHALVALAALPAAAQLPGPGSGGVEPEKSYASPKHFAFEAKFGPYKPSIDDEFPSGQTGPYSRYFGGSGLMSQFEFDYQLFQKFGSIGVGLGLGYFTKSGKSFPCLPGTGAACEPDFSTKSGDSTSINVLPLALLAIYRFDVLALRYRVPVVPYVKGGLTYSFWWINKGNGKVASVTGADGTKDNGRNGQFGLTVTGGVALMLDAFDTGAGRELDGALGINHTYIFWEWNWSGADGFGAKSALRIGDSNWLAGLAFEF
ncbi:MAG: hypothetical protein HY906_25030 [Deltaproteobacteria bacterium]|nr:hypothetical protein [Deltaproteobacteria bacterium]